MWMGSSSRWIVHSDGRPCKLGSVREGNRTIEPAKGGVAFLSAGFEPSSENNAQANSSESAQTVLIKAAQAIPEKHRLRWAPGRPSRPIAKLKYGENLATAVWTC